MGPDAQGQGAGGVESQSRPRRRSWGYWTEAKLDLLARYLDAFTTTTKYKSPHERIYLDAFAGEGRGLSRTTGEEFESSTRIALSIDDPPFSRLRFFELGRKATRLQEELVADFPGRDFKVVPGDCNETVPQVLAELKSAGVGWAPTFAFLDPDGMELRWDTIESQVEVELVGETLWVLLPHPRDDHIAVAVGVDDNEAIVYLPADHLHFRRDDPRRGLAWPPDADDYVEPRCV